MEDVDQLKIKLDIVKEKELTKYKDDILAEIKSEIAARKNGRKGRIIESLKYDNQFSTAINILNNNKSYENLLNIKVQ